MADRKISQWDAQNDPTGLEEIGAYDPTEVAGSDDANKRIPIKDAIKKRLVEPIDSFTLASTDQNKFFRCNKVTDITVTVNSSSLNVGEFAEFEQVSIGFVKLSASGVTIVGNGAPQTSGISTTIRLIKVSSTVFFCDKGTAGLSYGEKEETQVAHGFVAGDAIYHNGTQWTKAIADSDVITNDSFSTNIVIKALTADVFVVGGTGSMIDVDLGFTGAKGVYLSQDTAGELVDTAPTEGYLQQLGWYFDGVLYFHTHEPLGLNNVWDQETDDFKLNVLITGSRYEAIIELKTVEQFTITDLVPPGIAKNFDPDYWIEIITANPDSETLTHVYRFTQLTTVNAENVNTTTMNAVGESKRKNFRTSNSYYSVDATTLADIELNGIDMVVNYGTPIVYTGDITTKILFYGDLIDKL